MAQLTHGYARRWPGESHSEAKKRARQMITGFARFILGAEEDRADSEEEGHPFAGQVFPQKSGHIAAKPTRMPVGEGGGRQGLIGPACLK